VQALIDGLQEHRDDGPSPLSTPFANWLKRALQCDVRTAFQAPSEAQLAFESVLASDRSYVTSSAKLEEWVGRIGGIIDARRRPPEPEPPPPLPEPPPAPEPEQLAASEPIVIDTPEHIEEPEPEPIAEAPQDSAAVDVVSNEDAAVSNEDGAATVDAPVSWTPAPEIPSPPAAYAAADEEATAKPNRMPLVLMAGVIALLIGAVIWLSGRSPAAPRAGEGELVVESRPPGANVSIDGTKRGVTPLTVKLKSGAHVLEVQIGKAEPRVIPLTIQANVQVAQYIEMQGVQATGSLEIKSEPSGARVTIDGQPRGTTPATIRELPAGDHAVVLELGGRKVTQTVKVETGSTAQIVVPIPRR
jgi:hypothetical protein